MKLFKNLKKGFTLIELVVVIAVIAILSAVSVVSYVAITNKAKSSSDEQAVAQMNTILTANDVMDLKSIRDVLSAFEENGLDAEDYKPLMKDRYFFWDQDENRIIYTDNEYKVLFPESLKGKSKEGAHWLSLSGKIEERDYSSNLSNGSGKITGTATEAGEKLYKLAQDINSGSNKDLESATEKTIELPKEVDLAGSEFNLGTVQNATIKGESPSNPTVINNVFTCENQTVAKGATHIGRKYNVGLVQSVKGDVVFENLTIKNVSIGDYNNSKAAIFAGEVTSGSLTIRNCTIEDAYIYGEQKVSTIASYVTGGHVYLENVVFKNVHVYSEEGCAAGIVGYASSTNLISSDPESLNSLKANVTCELNKVSERTYKTIDKVLTDASNEVVSTFDSATNRKFQYGKKKATGGYDWACGDAVTSEYTLKRYKPGCAVYGWVADSANAIEGSDYVVDYGLKPLQFSDMVA